MPLDDVVKIETELVKEVGDDSIILEKTQDNELENGVDITTNEDPSIGASEINRSRSSSPEIIHIKTVAAPPKQKPQRSEDELKKLFEIEYLDKVLFSIHKLLTPSNQEYEVADASEDARKAGNEASSNPIKEQKPEETETPNGDCNTAETANETKLTEDEPDAKKIKIASNYDDSDDEITAVKTIEATPVIPGYNAALETKFSDLWDLSQQSQVAQFMYEKNCFSSLRDIVLKTSAGPRDIALGILANLSSIPEICELCYEDSDLISRLVSFFDDEPSKPQVQNQVLKLFSYCLQHEEEKWSELINKNQIIGKSFAFFNTEKPYVIEKIMENMGFIFDVSENVKIGLEDNSKSIESVCNALICYGAPSKESTSVETVGNILTVLTFLETNTETKDSFLIDCEKVLEALQFVLVKLDEKQFTFSYKSCICRILKLSIRVLARLSQERQLELVKKFHKLTMCAVDFLDLFEQDMEESEDFRSDDDYGMQHHYMVLSECYNFCSHLQELKDKLGEEKFFEGMTDELTEVINAAFENYSNSEKVNRNDSESDNDIVEISSSASQIGNEKKSKNEQEKSTETSEETSEISVNKTEDEQKTSDDVKTVTSKEDKTEASSTDAKQSADSERKAKVEATINAETPEIPKDGTEAKSEVMKDGNEKFEEATSDDKTSELTRDKTETESNGISNNEENRNEKMKTDKKENDVVNQDESIPDLSDTDL